ncbi:hypothetical protein V1477_020239, partial [Vespula maculifrons]
NLEHAPKLDVITSQSIPRFHVCSMDVIQQHEATQLVERFDVDCSMNTCPHTITRYDYNY